MLQTPNFATRKCLHLKGFCKISCFYGVSFLRYLQSLKSTSQMPINLLAKKLTKIENAKIELLIDFDREIKIKMNFSPVIYHYKRKLQTSRFIIDVAIIRKIIFNISGLSQRLSIWFLWKMVINYMKTFSFYFQNWKILCISRVMAIIYRCFQFLYQKCRR